ncbi:hypothetical protein CPC08DRAFT_710326 [Agrocybe pediades]|nr:hypothetical protein CPC08DRAFT_710326 [Agrocybe pediades]
MHIDPQSSVIRALAINSLTESTIDAINLYPFQAHITRSYKAKVTAGQTKITITHLPNVVDHDSVRVEGRGSAIIKGVSAFKAERKDEDEDLSSEVLDKLNEQRQRIASSKGRAEKARKVIGSYVGSIAVEHLDISKLGEAVDVYYSTDEKWDNKIRELEEEIKSLDQRIKAESDEISKPEIPVKLRTKVVIDVYADAENDLDIILVYAVSNASWQALYDIRVDMQGPSPIVGLTYQALISQETAEDWIDCPLILETARPTSGIHVPALQPWTIHYHGTVITAHEGKAPGDRGKGLGLGGAKRYRRIFDEDDLNFAPMHVTSTGHVNATFRVPGLTTVISNAEDNKVTIAELNLEANVSWICVPGLDTNVYLEARVTNSSNYTLIEGPSSIYVDNSYISRSEFPNTSPKEALICSLGIDPTVRVTYHPRTMIVSEAGFYTKSKKHVFAQRITVHNTKSVETKGVKIKENIPVSQDASLIVNLLTPALSSPTPSSKPTAATSVTSLKLSDGVVAQWTLPDGLNDTQGSFVPGQDGMLEWVCTIPALAKVNLLLEWEVVSNAKEEVVGLTRE